MTPRIRRVLVPGTQLRAGKSGGAGSNHLLGVHNPALYRVSYAPVVTSTAGGSRTHTGTVAHDLLRVARMHFATAA